MSFDPNSSRCGLCGEEANGAAYCWGCYDEVGHQGLIPGYGGQTDEQVNIPVYCEICGGEICSDGSGCPGH